MKHLPQAAREPRSRAFYFALLAGLLVAGLATEARAIEDQSRPAWTFRYRACQDAKVAGLVGRKLDDALARVRPMRLLAVRVLDRWTWVNYEVVPERLTMVVHDNGVVVRAFCR
ncbi:MAG: hypothetical protein WDO24_20950 [Pseudomonadota bacterium]